MDQTYQLSIIVEQLLRTEVGKLGNCLFPAGRYIYTGSARRNLAARVARHLSKNKRLRWHIDYLLTAPGVAIEGTQRFEEPECVVNGKTPGRIVVARFGASDCRAGCGSHLKYLGHEP